MPGEAAAAARVKGQILAAVAELQLDLRDATVLTEVGSGAFATTPVIAAAAGARAVYALTRDSAFGSTRAVSEQMAAIAAAAGVDPGRLHVCLDRGDVPGGVDIVTNLGFVRPIDRGLLGRLSPYGVVSLMCESWEARAGDVDFAACAELGVPVAGVWEDFGGLSVFRSCGQLAVKMCFEAGLEIAGNRIVVVSPDHFGPVIEAALLANGARVARVASAAGLSAEVMNGTDAVVLADYTRGDTALGGSDGPGAAELAAWCPGLVLVQFAGVADVPALRAAGVAVYPREQLAPRRMARTLGHLGTRPVVYLHAAGLKVGELLWRERRFGDPPGSFAALVQPMGAQR
jgi:hypothetical protein